MRLDASTEKVVLLRPTVQFRMLMALARGVMRVESALRRLTRHVGSVALWLMDKAD